MSWLNEAFPVVELILKKEFPEVPIQPRLGQPLPEQPQPGDAVRSEVRVEAEEKDFVNPGNPPEKGRHVIDSTRGVGIIEGVRRDRVDA